MKHSTFSSMILLGAALAVAAATYAQQPADTTQPAPAATPAAPTATTPTSASPTSTTPTAAPNATAAATAAPKPSKDLLKKARESGYYTKLRKGQTFFCKKEVQLGSRFDTEHCLSDEQMAMVLERNQAQRDQLRSSMCGGSSCGGGR